MLLHKKYVTKKVTAQVLEDYLNDTTCFHVSFKINALLIQGNIFKQLNSEKQRIYILITRRRLQII